MRYFEEFLAKIIKSRSLRLFFLVLAIFATAITTSSCQSQQEKKGASAIPINKPARWENNINTGAN